MKKIKPNVITLEVAHTYVDSRGYLEYNKIIKENYKDTLALYTFCDSIKSI